MGMARDANSSRRAAVSETGASVSFVRRDFGKVARLPAKVRQNRQALLWLMTMDMVLLSLQSLLSGNYGCVPVPERP